MHPIIYDVAVSIDGFICGPGGDISRFSQEGPVVTDYSARLEEYATAIMGRATYEFGYRFGMEPGQNPYPHMKTILFTKSLNLPDSTDVDLWAASDLASIEAVRNQSTGPIYLCGGGAFAGSLLAMGQIDVLRLKRAPVILGDGIRLFGETNASPVLEHIEIRSYDNGYLFQEFRILQSWGRPDTRYASN